MTPVPGNSHPLENLRYSRMVEIPEIGPEGMTKIAGGSALIIGAGALGSLIGMYLAGAGVGRIGLADFDTIDISNLHRQLFFSEEECGKKKIQVLAERMRKLNSSVCIEVYEELITQTKALKVFQDYDFIIDGSDNPATKLMTDQTLFELGKAGCIGGVREGSGQVMTYLPGCVRYSQIFGSEQTCTGMTPCSIGGVMGPAAGIVASTQASEVIKFLADAPGLLKNKILVFNLFELGFRIINLK